MVSVMHELRNIPRSWEVRRRTRRRKSWNTSGTDPGDFPGSVFRPGTDM